MFDKAGMRREVVVLAMFKHKHAIGTEHVVLEDEVGQLWQFGQGIRWVGKDKVELPAASLDEPEHISTQRYAVVSTQFLQALADKGMMVFVGLYTDYA